MLRPLNPMAWESGRANLSLAGVRYLAQGSVAVGASAEGTYTVVNGSTRRVIVAFAGTFGDIRFDYNATASATDFPLMPNTHFRVDAAKDGVLHFYNTSGGSITVYLMEIE